MLTQEKCNAPWITYMELGKYKNVTVNSISVPFSRKVKNLGIIIDGNGLVCAPPHKFGNVAYTGLVRAPPHWSRMHTTVTAARLWSRTRTTIYLVPYAHHSQCGNVVCYTGLVCTPPMQSGPVCAPLCQKNKQFQMTLVEELIYLLNLKVFKLYNASTAFI